MPLFRSPAHMVRSLVRRRAPAWAAALGALALFAASCSDNQVAGTSSGVDNPALTVSFASSGAAARVTGDLSVYAADQNPAIDSKPLVTINVKNSAFTLISGDDFRRAQQASAKRGSAKPGAAKLAAAVGAAGAGDRTVFNLVLTTEDRNGGIEFGLVYDSVARVFTKRDSSVRSVALETKPLVRYQARVAKEPVHGENCRVFVPGTPYLASLVDSQFVFVDLPQGLLPLRLIGADGGIYPVPDSLNTADSGLIYRPSSTRSGSIDTLPPADSLPDFTIAAPDSFEAFVEGHTYLEAKVAGISATDPRLLVHWSLLHDSIRPPAPDPLPDTLHHDSHPGDPPPPPELLFPNSLRTEVHFNGVGIYRFLVTATFGSRIRFDSVLVSVRHESPLIPEVLSPDSGETLYLAKPYTVQWQMPGKGPYNIEVSTNNGERWTMLASGYLPPDSLQIFPWTPSQDLGTSDRCLLRISNSADTTQHVDSQYYFHLVLH
jgi:hypothetical protein